MESTHPSALTPLSGERPLSRPERVGLVLAAIATLLVFYATSLVALVVLLALVALIFVVMIGASRIGMARLLSPSLAREWGLVCTIVRSYWLRRRREYRIVMAREDAPRLYAMLDDLSARIGVAAPSEVAVEMNAGAWVRLDGYRRGAGSTTLGIGYDLLAALPEGEVEAVLAHEMTHAKLIQRGLSSWMYKGVGRLVKLAEELEETSQAYRAAKRPSYTCNVLYAGADALTRVAARLTSTYSRQLEFEADLGAAAVCGSAPLRASLLRLERLHAELDRLPWNERIARLETEPSFSQWLVGEVARRSDPTSAEPADHAPDPYSMHPALRDRLRALPMDASSVANQRPGIELLARPDAAASELVTQIQRVIDESEAEDTAQLDKRRKALEESTRILPRQWPGVLIGMTGATAAFIALGAKSWEMLFAGLGAAIVGLVLYRIANYGDGLPLPVPAFGALTSTRPAGEDLAAAEKLIEAELQARFGETGSRRQRLDAYVTECYAQLEARDYLRAHVAGRLAYRVDKNSVEAGLGLAVASAGLGIAKQATVLLSAVRQRTGLKSRMTRWGTAWALSLLGAWDDAEAILNVLVRKDPAPATWWSLVALARSNRGKFHGAIAAARRAVALEPENTAHRVQLAELLLATGRPREAGTLLQEMETLARSDVKVAGLFVRLHLMMRRLDEALTWTAEVRRLDPEPGRLAWLGAIYEQAREDDHAVRLFGEAMAAGHSPECLLGLARIHAARGDRAAARAHMLEALNVDKPLAPFASSPIPLFAHIVDQINEIDDRLVACSAWVAVVPAGDTHPMSGRTLLVCARNEEEARSCVDEIALALQPSAPRPMSDVVWRVAKKDQQPIRPVSPGIKAVLA